MAESPICAADWGTVESPLQQEDLKSSEAYLETWKAFEVCMYVCRAAETANLSMQNAQAGRVKLSRRGATPAGPSKEY